MKLFSLIFHLNLFFFWLENNKEGLRQNFTGIDLLNFAKIVTIKYHYESIQKYENSHTLEIKKETKQKNNRSSSYSRKSHPVHKIYTVYTLVFIVHHCALHKSSN